jgi:hypothetical protein
VAVEVTEDDNREGTRWKCVMLLFVRHHFTPFPIGRGRALAGASTSWKILAVCARMEANVLSSLKTVRIAEQALLRKVAYAFKQVVVYGPQFAHSR